MRLVLITTCVVADPARPPLLERLLASVRAAREADPSLAVRHLLLLQGKRAAQPPSGDAYILHSPEIMPLSAARNRLLAKAERLGLTGEADVIGFPDDDAWYPPGTLTAVAAAFRQDDLDLWFCRYGASPLPPGIVPGRRPAAAEAVRCASSNTIFVRGSLARAVGPFDEALGAGGRFGGGEDNDYALRAFLHARESLFLDACCVGHRDFGASHRAHYWPGGLIALARHSVRQPALKHELARKMMVGAALVARGELGLSAFLGGGAAAWRARRAARARPRQTR